MVIAGVRCVQGVFSHLSSRATVQCRPAHPPNRPTPPANGMLVPLACTRATACSANPQRRRACHRTGSLFCEFGFVMILYKKESLFPIFPSVNPTYRAQTSGMCGLCFSTRLQLRSCVYSTLWLVRAWRSLCWPVGHHVVWAGVGAGRGNTVSTHAP